MQFSGSDSGERFALERKDSTRAMIEDPVGAYLAGASFLVWSFSSRWIGAVHTGEPTTDEDACLLDLIRISSSSKLAHRFDAYLDVSFLTRFAEHEYAFFERLLREPHDQLAGRMRRLALVRPGHMVGATIEGMYHQWMAGRVESLITPERAEAYAFLGMSAAACDASDALIASHTRPMLLRHLHAALSLELRDATVASLAEALGTSPRSLQRELAAHGTSFRDELVRARLEAAEVRLRDPSIPVERIARDVGFGSTAALTTAYTRTRGEPPTAFRRRWMAKLGAPATPPRKRWPRPTKRRKRLRG